MPQLYLRICFLWTYTIVFSFSAIAAAPSATPPPVLSNPSDCNLGLIIKDFSCDASHFFQINVNNAPGTSLGSDVYLKEVRVIIAHEWDADLSLTLISPNDVAIDLSSDNGSGRDNYGNPSDCTQYTSFLSPHTEMACQTPSISSGMAPFIGAYLPEQDFLPLHDGTDPNDLWVLQICDDGKEHEGTLEFVQLVFEAAGCLNPVNVEITQADSTTAWLTWEPGGHCDSTLIEYGPVGFVPGSGAAPGSATSTIVADSCPPVLLTGLTPSTTYDLYVRSKCSNSISINSCVASFSTTCSPPPATLREDFNSQINCTAICGVPCHIEGIWHNSLVDDFDWIVSDKNNITTTGTGPSDDHPGGGKYIYMESSQSLCRGGREGALVSNCLLIKTTPDTCDLSYDYLLYGPHVEALRLEYKQTDSTQWKLLDIMEGNHGDQWRTRYIDLDPLNGQSVQFRFVAVGGNGQRGDIALDNIVFYGSEDLGPPPFVYYRDKDMDGYGGQDVWFATCSFQSVTPGFVPNNLDCDDDNFFINPGYVEYPCDGMDRNCNGMADEYTFDPPLTSDTVICSGAEVPFKAVPRFNGEVVWFSDSTGMDTVFTGSTFWLPDFPSNPGDEPLSLTFYAQEFRNDSCFSATRSAATITILPQPDIITSDNPVICEGDTFDLNTVDVIDINGANGIITFHSSEQITPDTEVDPLVVPSHTQDTYYIASTPPGGCTDVVAVQFSLLPAPDAQIAGEELVCKNANQTLVANDTGNAPLPLSYQWNTGDTTRSITIASHPLPDSSEVIFIEMTAANGCTDSDTLTITTINNIHQVQRIVEDVSTCGGSDGAITLTPLDGLPPFTFHWGNGQTFTGNSLTLTNLEQGTYSFTITDSSPQQCDFTIPLMTVNGPGAVVAASEVVDVSCNGLSDGAIHLNVNGTNPVITWENGSNGASLENVPAGNHSVTITDGTCENVLQFVVDQPDKLTVNPVIDPPRCSYSANGSVTLYTFGGNPPYQYNWQNGLTTQQINHLPAGNYPVTITDTKGCVQEFPTLEVPAPPALFFDTTTLSQPACFGFDNGKISVKPEGGTPPYDVDWSNGGMGTTINSLAAGNFTVSIEDANGCLLTGMLSLEQPAPLTMTFDTLTNPHCKGNEDGWIAATTTGGTPPYQYIWNNDHTTEDLTNLPEGTYQVTVTDNHLCTWTSPVVTLTGPKLITVEADIQHPPCIGRNEGSITVVPNGNGSYSFDWDIDESGPSITDQAPGFYTVTITDNTTLCQTDTTFQLTTAQVLTLHVDFRHPACFGVPGGEIYLLPAGGTEPYSYQWSGTSETTSFRTMLPAGNYAASVTDAQGCIISTDIIPLYYPAPIRLDLLSFDALPCYGDSTGAIEVLATGGTGNLHYKWSTNDTLPNLNDLGPGIYTLSVYDENNCSVNEEYEITWPPPLTVEAERFITGCHILDSVCITPTGGMAPYNYSWNYSDTLTTCLTDVPVGDYTVTVTDQLGCSKVLESVKITDQASPVYIQLLPSEDSLCFGQTNGSLSVLIDGGSLPYQYIWEHGEAGTTFDTVLTVNNLAPGPYWVTITDNEGCTSVSPILTVEEGEQLTAVVASHNDVQCKGYANGAILLAVEGGFPPYGAAWTDAAGSIIGEGLSIDSLPAGIYSALITDAQQCVYQLETTLTEPEAPLMLNTFHIEPPVCFGDENAGIDIEPIGGTSPYRYFWSTNDTTPNIANLAAGVYFLTITDANGCSYTDSFSVSGPAAPLSLAFHDIQLPNCFGDANGSIDVDITGGTPPYFYDWGMSNQEDLFNIAAGPYTLTVYDSTFLCLFDTTFIVEEPDSLVADTSATAASPGNMDGTATVEPHGGTPPYSILWETGETTNTITGLAPGWYEFVVTDAHGCTMEGGVLVGLVNGLIDPGYVHRYSLFPNPVFEKTNLVMEMATTETLQLQIFNTFGEIIYSDSYPPSRNINQPISMKEWPAGVYLLLVKNNSQLLISDRIVKYSP